MELSSALMFHAKYKSTIILIHRRPHAWSPQIWVKYRFSHIINLETIFKQTNKYI